MQDKFYDKLSLYVRNYYQECVIVFTDSLKYNRHYVVPAASLTPDIIHHIKAKYNNAVAFCVADSSIYLNTAKESVQKAIDNEEYDNVPGAPENVMKMEDTEFINLLNRCRGIRLGVRKRQVKKRPWTFLDIDLKDQLSVLHDKKLIDSNIDIEEFRRMIEDMLPEDKLKLIQEIVDIDSIWEETDPNLILFSGNGLHIWYALPPESTYTSRKFNAVYKNLLENAKSLCPYIVFDDSCGDLNRNMRLPYTLNIKGNVETPVVVLKQRDIDAVPSSIKDTFSVYESIDDHDHKQESSSDFMGNLLQNTLQLNDRSIYEGLLDLQKDYRLFRFVKQNLTFENILSYLNIPLPNDIKASEENGWKLCSSPFREDRNPSFRFNNYSLGYGDFSENLSGDFGELMMSLLDLKKKNLELYHMIPTTKAEAELHCIYVSYLNYCNKFNIRDAKFPFTLQPNNDKKDKDEDEDNTNKKKNNTGKAPKKVVIPGESYYDIMALQFQQMTEAAKKKFQEAYKNGMDAFVRSVIMGMPNIYYFFDFNPKFKDNLMQTYSETVRLGIQKLFLDHKISLMLRTAEHKVEIYINYFGVHNPFSNFFKYNAGAEEKKGLVTEIATAVNSMNIFGAPGLEGKSCKSVAEDIYNVYFRLKDLEKEFNDHIKGLQKVNATNIDSILIDFINNMYKMTFVKEDLCINVVNSKKYIRFKNAFVLYESEDPEEIGLMVPLTNSNKYELIKNNIVDVIIPYDYNPDGKIDKFMGFLDFLNHDGNKAKAIISYLFGSMLFKPNGATTRAVILYGLMGKNGKSVIADIAAGLLTERYVSQMAIHDISRDNNEGKIARMKLSNKILNISADSSGEHLESAFKSLVSGDAVEVKELYKTPKTIHMRAHFLVNVNRMLKLKGNEAKPFMRRVLTVKLDKIVKPGEENPNLANDIIKHEACHIWPWIIEQAKLYKKNGIYSFLTPQEIERNEELLLVTNDIYTFVEEFMDFDPEAFDKREFSLSKFQFKRWYTTWRQKQGRYAPGTDDILYEALTYIHYQFGDVIPSDILNKGFEFKDSKGKRGLPGLYLQIPKKEVGRFEDVDTRNEQEDVPEKKKKNKKGKK